MSTPIVYPDSLPSPKFAPVLADERRALPNGRPFSARDLQRDRLATRQIQFPPFTSAEMQAFRDFWRDDLDFGGNWFSASRWPTPDGTPWVYKWISVTHNENVPGGYWDVSGVVEVRGVGMPPVSLTPPLFLLHFENNLTDVAGHLFEADTIITDAAPNSFTYTTSDPLFGSYSGRFPGTNNHIRSETFPDLQLADFDFQFEGFFRPRDTSGDIGGPLLATGSLQTGGNVIGPAPEAGQFYLECDEDGIYTVRYATALGSDTLVTVGSPAAAAIDEWNYFRFVSDASGMSLYGAPVSAGTAPRIARAVGLRPFAGAYSALQRFFIGCRYTGGAPPLEVYLERYHGDVKDFRGLLFTTETHGSSVEIPTASFSNAGA